MKEFFKKTLYLWVAILCFGLAIGTFAIVSDFFEHGKGFIRVKGIIAPVVFAIFGLWSLWNFIKKSVREKNYVEFIVSILLVAAVAGGVFYFSSTDFKIQRLMDNIRSNKITEEESMSEITALLNSEDIEIQTKAIECLEMLAEKGSVEACFKLGEVYFEHGDYDKAENYLTYVCEISEPKEVVGNDYREISHDLALTYEYLGDINSAKSSVDDKSEAIVYYERAIQYPFNLHTDIIQNKIEAVKKDIK